MKTYKIYFFLFLLAFGVAITGCVDNDFDEPEDVLRIQDDEVMAIADVLALLGDEDEVLLDDSNIGEDTMYIKATVNGDDASGNFFKLLTFQDETGALAIIPDRNELNAEFAVGRRIYIRLQGLTLALNNNLPTLGYGVSGGFVQRIPDILVGDFLIAGGEGDSLVPEVTTISEIAQNAPQFYNKLIQLENVEFREDFVGQTFADPDNPEGPFSVNTIIQDCDDESIILRNSGFADFASDIIPAKRGTLTAIVGVFDDDLQLYIRDTDDIEFTKERCDGSGGNEDLEEIDIQSIQERFYQFGVDQAEKGYITGIVISDKETGQVNRQNVFLQNGDRGILVRFSSEHSFDLGDELEIVITGQEISEYRGLLQINEVPLFNAERLGSKALPAPNEITIAQILENNNRYESTRVLIKNATLSGPSTFGGTVTVDDGSGEIIIFTFNSTSYANDPVPSGEVDVTAVVSQFDETVQLLINSASDISGGTVNPGGDENVNLDFEGEEDFDPISEPGWLNIATKGDRLWYYRSFDNNGFAECEAFQDDNPETEAWLITPSIDTGDKSMFSFQSAKAFWKHQGLSVWISPDFTTFSDANWVEMDQAVLADDSYPDFDFVDSGEIDLRDYFGGNVRVGFKYEGTSASNTTKIRIDNVKLR